MFTLNQVADSLGLLGVGLTLVAYLLLNLEYMKPDGFWYAFLNAVGSCGILLSLAYAWNIAAFTMEICWLAISLFGLGKYWYKH